MVSTSRQKEHIEKITATFLLARNDHGCEEHGSSLCGMPERELRQERESSLGGSMTARMTMMDMATKFPDAGA